MDTGAQNTTLMTRKIMKMKFKLLTALMIIMVTMSSYAYVIRGTATEPVMNGDIAKADEEARENSMLDALKNYFGRLKSIQPDKEIPDVTAEFFKFIRSYKIAERKYENDNVTYTILADVDDVALNDLTYFVRNAVNTIVYNIKGIPSDINISQQLDSAFAEYKFDTKYQSEYQASLRENSTESERFDTYLKGSSQYFMEMDVIREPTGENQCTVILTTQTFSKTKEFQVLKTKSSAEHEDDDECIQSALTLSLVKTLGYVRSNFIPLPGGEHKITNITLTAENYDNFATPKKIVEELKKRSFIESYKILSFAGNKLEVEVSTYVDIDVLLKKLQSIELEYDFSASKQETNNILLDFSN